MRVLALLLLMASCGEANRTNQAEPLPGVGGPQSGTSRPAPTILIAATGPGGCSASWDGRAATPAQITERSVALLERAIAAVGGARNVTEESLPVFNVEAPADMSFACADTILFALQRSGLMTVRLRPAGGAPVLVDFPLGDLPEPPVPMVIGVGAGGRLSWNDEPVAPEALAARLRQTGSDSGPGPGELAAPPGGPELRPSREATFGQVCEVLGMFRGRHIRPLLILPSAEAGPAGPVAAPLPAPPPPAGG